MRTSKTIPASRPPAAVRWTVYGVAAVIGTLFIFGVIRFAIENPADKKVTWDDVLPVAQQPAAH